MNPAFTTRGDIAVVGLAQPFRKSEGVDGPAVWRRFRPFVERIPNCVGDHTFGLNEVVDTEAGELIYAPAVEVTTLNDLPEELFGPGQLFRKVLEGGRFAVFAFPLAGGDIGADFRRAYDFIYGEWAQQDGACLRARYDFEVYDERFDPATLTGEASIWVPVA